MSKFGRRMQQGRASMNRMSRTKRGMAMVQTMVQEKWKLRGLDTFSNESYDLPGEYASLKEAEAAAEERLLELEKTQPSGTSGGQSFAGIQDRVFVIKPDGTEYRYTRKGSTS